MNQAILQLTTLPIKWTFNLILKSKDNPRKEQIQWARSEDLKEMTRIVKSIYKMMGPNQVILLENRPTILYL